MALRFNRSLRSPIHVLSFDLDDTLYFNEEVIQKAEHHQFDTICRLVPDAEEHGIKFWLKLKRQIAKQQPDLIHDVTAWRQQVIRTGLSQFGLAGSYLSDCAAEVYDEFYLARSDFEVPQQTFDVLSQLSKKFPLIAVTNGNADIGRLRLAPYFVGYYRAGENNTRSKPFPDLLQLASAQLDIPEQNILHIGDNLDTDIKAALNAGCQSLWFNALLSKSYPGQILADGEYSNLDDLLHLL